MTKSDRDRVFVFRRILNEELYDYTDEQLLTILNAAVLPNSLSKTAFKYSLLSNLIFNKTETNKSIKKISYLEKVMSKIEKDLLKFGILYGFDSFNSGYQYSRFIKTSLDTEKINIGKKKISSLFFERIFVFIYNIVKKGEKNERFTRI